MLFSVDGDNKQQAKINASVAWLEAFLTDRLIEVAEVLFELDDSSINDSEEFKSPDHQPALILDSEQLSRELPLRDVNNFCQHQIIAVDKILTAIGT